MWKRESANLKFKVMRGLIQKPIEPKNKNTHDYKRKRAKAVSRTRTAQRDSAVPPLLGDKSEAMQKQPLPELSPPPPTLWRPLGDKSECVPCTAATSH